MVSGTVEEQVELNGSDYVLDLISELELPPSFPAVKPFFLSSGSRFVKARNEPEFVARMDFGPEDDGFGSPRNTARRRLQGMRPIKLSAVYLVLLFHGFPHLCGHYLLPCKEHGGHCDTFTPFAGW